MQRKNDQAGTTLVELMVALFILLVVINGFWGAVFQSVNSTGVAQRRTVGTWLRGDLVDRLSLSSRSYLDAPNGVAVPQDTWLIEQCYDNGGRPTTGNPAFLAAFTCGAEDGYRRWVRVVKDQQQVNDFGFAGPIWRITVVVENISSGCAPDDWKTSTNCVGAQYYLTD